jgi:hypothetical protein
MKITLDVGKDFLDKETSITQKIYNTYLSTYTILNYNEDNVDENTIEYLNYHSVILDNDSNKILSYAPPKPIEKTADVHLDNKPLYVNEYIEGTFIHLFYDERISSWEIATKRAVGGNYTFYHIPDIDSLTYRQMFIEACGFPKSTPLIEIPFLLDLQKNRCYGFVLQHPSNHIVLSVLYPKLFIVSIYEIKDNLVTYISPDEYLGDPIFKNYNIYYPLKYDLEKISVNELCKIHSSIHTPLITMGIMLIDLSTGKNYAVINPNYTEMAILRGNHPNIQYQYLCLQRIHRLNDFLRFFPQYTNEFLKYKNQYEQFIVNVHQSYLSYYVKKEGVVISPKYFPTIYNIHHSIFIPSIASKNKIIVRKKVVKEYMDTLDPAKILFLLNYDHHFTTYT